MTLIIRAPGAQFSNFSGVADGYPVVTGLVGSWYLGSQELNRMNTVTSANASVVGTPTVNARSIIASTSNCYETDLTEQAQFTFIAIAKKHAGRAVKVGAIVPASHYGVGLIQDTNMLHLQVGLSSGPFYADLAFPGADGEVRFMAGTCSATHLKICYGLNGNITSATSAPFGLARQVKTSPLRIGGHTFPPLSPATHEMYAAAVHNIALSDEQLAEIYQHYRARYAARGITVA